MKMSTLLPWRDPRLAAGILLIAGGGVAGSFLLAAQDTVAFLQAKAPIAAGSPLDESQFVVAELPANIGHGYLRHGTIPQGAVARHAIGGGELLNSSAVGEVSTRVDLKVPLLSEPPTTLTVGDSVDIWRVRSGAINVAPEARMIARGAILVSVDVDERVSAKGAAAQLRVEAADVPAILETLGGQDGLVIVSGGRR